MRFLIDTNILLYAANRSCREYPRASQFLRSQLDDLVPFCLTWGVLYEFFRVATHPGVFPDPLTAAQAFRFVSDLVEEETVTVLQPTGRHHQMLGRTLSELPHLAGNIFHDIETAVLAREHGVREIVTADTDFLQFRFLTVTNPML